jgi:hypothetical protein
MVRRVLLGLGDPVQSALAQKVILLVNPTNLAYVKLNFVSLYVILSGGFNSEQHINIKITETKNCLLQ